MSLSEEAKMLLMAEHDLPSPWGSRFRAATLAALVLVTASACTEDESPEHYYPSGGSDESSTKTIPGGQSYSDFNRERVRAGAERMQKIHERARELAVEMGMNPYAALSISSPAGVVTEINGVTVPEHLLTSKEKEVLRHSRGLNKRMGETGGERQSQERADLSGRKGRVLESTPIDTSNY